MSRLVFWVGALAAGIVGCSGSSSNSGVLSTGGAPVSSGGSIGVAGAEAAGGDPGSGGATVSSSGGSPSSTGGVATVGGTTSSSGGVTAGSGGTVTGTGGTAGASGAGGASSGGASGGAGGSNGASTGIFPPVTDPGKAGSFTPTTVTGTGPMNNYTAILPRELGQNGLKHPIVIWGNGAVLTPSNYTTLLNHVASHGFAILAYNTTPQGAEMTAAIDWMVAENTRQGSSYEGKLDTTKIAAMGHSAGSVATFQIAADMRLTTTMHFDGGTFDPHTDEKNLRMPAAFICGDAGGDGLLTGDVARPNCDIDFMNATTPVWYGDIKGASHLTIGAAAATDPMMAKGFLAATAGWLRWQLAGDQTMKKLFVGASCDLCSETDVWTVQQKNLM